jgi:GNAT superfamily N-acetyltransferase
MSGDRADPDEPAGPFEGPPRTATDREGREIRLRAYEPADREALVEMYLAFDPADRAQGIPPGDETRVRSWLDTITDEGCLNVVAWHGDDAVGHATLVPEAAGCEGDEGTGRASELAIFVLQSHQRAGIGTLLIRTLLGYGAREGIERVWLTVERWNRAATNLYEKIGFEVSDAESFELEMTLRLA